MAAGSSVGWVKFFHPQRGYGFLKDVATGQDVFVHYSSLQRREQGWRGLYRGEYVAYRPAVNADGNVAASEVTGVAGGPLLCEAGTIVEPEFA